MYILKPLKIWISRINLDDLWNEFWKISTQNNFGWIWNKFRKQYLTQIYHHHDLNTTQHFFRSPLFEICTTASSFSTFFSLSNSMGATHRTNEIRGPWNGREPAEVWQWCGSNGGDPFHALLNWSFLNENAAWYLLRSTKMATDLSACANLSML